MHYFEFPDGRTVECIKGFHPEAGIVVSFVEGVFEIEKVSWFSCDASTSYLKPYEEEEQKDS